MEINSRDRRFEVLSSVLELINSSLTLEEMLEKTMKNAVDLMAAERGFIMMYDEESEKLSVKTVCNLKNRELESEALRISRTIVQDVFKTKTGILTHNALQDPRFKDNASVISFGLRSIIAVPLIVKGSCAGVIYLDNRLKKNIFDEKDLDFMSVFAHEVAIALENSRLEYEKNYIRQLFRHYVSPDVAEELIQNGLEINLRGEKRTVTVGFVDIRGFTALSEKSEPQALFRQINEFFEEMVAVVFYRSGTLLKFLGDGFMMAFGAPVQSECDEEQAVLAALDMLEKLRELNAKWLREGKETLDIGIGVHCGEAMVGTVGSTSRREYSVVGDVPNTASRLEALNKDYKSRLIISEAVFRKCALPHLFREIGKIGLRGKKEKIKIYRLK